MLSGGGHFTEERHELWRRESLARERASLAGDLKRCNLIGYKLKRVPAIADEGGEKLVEMGHQSSGRTRSMQRMFTR